MKILQIIPTIQKGDAKRLCLDICNTLQKKETHQVQLINFHPKNDYPFLTENIDRYVVLSSFIPSLTGKSQIQRDALQKAIDSFQPDVIHALLIENAVVHVLDKSIFAYLGMNERIIEHGKIYHVKSFSSFSYQCI